MVFSFIPGVFFNNCACVSSTQYDDEMIHSHVINLHVYIEVIANITRSHYIAGRADLPNSPREIGA